MPSLPHSLRPSNTPCVLIVRDGWGENPHPTHDAFNAVRLASTPIDDHLRANWPFTLIKTSGEDVGLLAGTMGNSEVGHQNIGAGRIVDQEAVRITRVCRGDGGKALAQIENLTGPIRRAITAGRGVHLMGICSNAGVHGLLTHLTALLELCASLGAAPDRVLLHLFTDGRDTGPFTGRGFVEYVENELARIGVGRVSSVIGRYWGLDRDDRWERVARAYACLTGEFGGDERAPRGGGASGGAAAVGGVSWSRSAADAVQAFYDKPEVAGMAGDEFVIPTMIGATREEALKGRIQSGDTVVFYNFRGDRPRELVSAFVLPEFYGSPSVKPSPDSGVRGFDRGPRLDLEFVTMTGYSEAMAPHVKVAFERPARMKNIAGEYLSDLGLRQFRCAETEKRPHVTFFFNDYRDDPFPGEHREGPQSPRVATYDLKPEMAAYDVRDAVLRRLADRGCEDVLIVNFANADMVGHTGSLPAAIKACEVVDECVGTIMNAVLAKNGSLVITADHGNAEQMWDPESNAPHTAHTVYPVPLYVVAAGHKGRRLRSDGRLADVVPTMLDLMKLAKPPEMTGVSLLA
ncbi:MAG: 2,3-bisphosphoglycerate-independent phosphoglycerate mutase [Phycisphaerales bacterium]|nr:2,3-bisphosphoglycerate-independent phosphoglycerate mutase [Phycisphaerales bacterium]